MRWVATNPSPLFPKCAKCATYEGTETNLEDVEVILPKFYNLHDQNFQAPTRLQILMYKFTGLDFLTRLPNILVSAMEVKYQYLYFTYTSVS